MGRDLIPGTLALLALALWLRLMPARRARVGGVDAWYYLLYAGALRRQRRLPARLPHFLLDIEEQWYPPLFPGLLAVLPDGLRFRARGWVSSLIDCLHLLLLVAVATRLGLEPTAALLAGLIYAVTPTLVHEHSLLNSRSLGSLLLTLFVLSLLAFLLSGGWAWVAMGGLLGGALLMTHKMATQLLAFMIPALALIEGRPALLGTGALAVACAIALSGGFYLSVFRGHVAILRFWRTEVENLNAHQVYDSPVYGGDKPPHRRFYERGPGGQWRLARVLVAHNPWALLLPLLTWAGPRDPVGSFLLSWAWLACAAALLTTFVPALRFLGEGFKYLKFAAFPLAFLAGRALAGWPEALWALPPLALSGAAIRRLLWTRSLETMDEDFRSVIAFLKADSRGRVATIPSHRSDPLAFLAGKQVLWGGHSAGYEKLRAWYPVIRHPLAELLDAYGAPLLLIDREYVDPRALHLDTNFRVAFEKGRFLVLERRPPERGA